MEFRMDQEYEMLRQTAIEFATRELVPYEEMCEANDGLPEDIEHAIRKKCVEAGLNALNISEENGGDGYGALGIAVYSEAIRATTSNAMFSMIGYCDPTLEHCNEEQKKRFLYPIMKMEKKSCFALTEPEAGSDAGNIKTHAVKKGDRWVINGTKRFISHGVDADVAMLYAITDPEKRLATCFMVEKGTPGFSIGQIHDTMGFRGYNQCELIFEDCEVPEENILGEVNKGWDLSNEWLSEARTALAARCNGTATQALRLARDHAANRVQFGKPIGDFQAIQFYMAKCATNLYASRWMTYKTAWDADHEEGNDKRAMNEKSAMCKYFAAETMWKTVDTAVQIHGGMGYMKESKIERIFRDARIERIWEGSSEIMLRNIGRGLQKRGIFHF